MKDQAGGNAFETIADFLIADRQGNEGLNADDRLLATIGCLLAGSPSSPELRGVLKQAIGRGQSPELLQTMLIHATGYLGVIATRRAHELLCAELNSAGLPKTVSAVAQVAAKRQERVDSGIRLYDRFDPGRQAQQAAKFATLSADYYPRAMELAGLVLASPVLAARERQIMTVAMLSCLGGQADQLSFHIGVALRNGVSKETLGGILILVQAYAGMPRANSAAGLAVQVLELKG